MRVYMHAHIGCAQGYAAQIVTKLTGVNRTDVTFLVIAHGPVGRLETFTGWLTERAGPVCSLFTRHSPATGLFGHI